MNVIDKSLAESSKYCVNDLTGVIFITHPDMFHIAPNPRSLNAPGNVRFFADYDEAKTFSDQISGEKVAKADAVKSVEAPEKSREPRDSRAKSAA
jgi:hypothetical protein